MGKPQAPGYLARGDGRVTRHERTVLHTLCALVSMRRASPPQPPKPPTRSYLPFVQPRVCVERLPCSYTAYANLAAAATTPNPLITPPRLDPSPRPVPPLLPPALLPVWLRLRRTCFAPVAAAAAAPLPLTTEHAAPPTTTPPAAAAATTPPSPLLPYLTTPHVSTVIR